MLNRTLIIAEAGVNHNGDLALAKTLIDRAASAGADVVKFQTFKADRLVVRDAEKAEYQRRTDGEQESQYEMLRRLELDADMHRVLISHCAARSIEFLSTGFDLESIDLLASLGQSRFKVPSGELTNLPYLRQVGRIGKSVLLSTGMANLGEVEAAIAALESAGLARTAITVLHCTTEYPTAMVDVNLRAMLAMKEAFGVNVGYSDHTPGITVPIAAVTMGATVIEKHLTLDRDLPGPDHRASLEPPEFEAMVVAIRDIEVALGDGVKRPSRGEAKNRVVARKSLVAARSIRAGEVFDADNIAAKRPGTGISPMRWDDVVGRKAVRDFAADEMLEL